MSWKEFNPFRLRAIEFYVFRASLGGIMIAAFTLATLIFLIDFIEVSRTIGERSDINFIQVLGLTALKSPNVILTLVPFMVMYGVQLAFVMLNRKSELVAMRAAGLSAWRFIRPAVLAALAIGVINVLVLNPVAASLANRFEQKRAELTEAKSQETQPGQKFIRQGDGHTQVVIHFKERTAEKQLKGVSLWVFGMEPSGQAIFKKRIEAESAELKKGFWQLTKAREAGPGETARAYERLSIPSPLDAHAAFRKVQPAQTVPFWILPKKIYDTKSAGFSATPYTLQFFSLMAQPFLLAGMACLGAAFSLQLMRLGGLARQIGTGIVMGFVFFSLNALCNSLGKADVVPAVLAAFTPPILVILAGVSLITYREDG